TAALAEPCAGPPRPAHCRPAPPRPRRPTLHPVLRGKRPLTPRRRRLLTTPPAAPSRRRLRSRATTIAAALLAHAQPAAPARAHQPLRIFISVDMEGLGGIGTGAMTRSSGKDYATGRRLMTVEVNAVVAAIFEH